MRSILMKSTLLVAAMLLPALVSGCDMRRQIDYATWKQVEPFAEASAVTQELSHRVQFRANSAELSSAEKVALLAFLERQGINPGTRVVLRSETAHEGEAATVSDRLAVLRRVLVARSLDVEMAPPSMNGAAEDVTVTAYKTAVAQIDCPGYNTPIELDQEWRPISNNGCANAINLGLMLENPSDLAAGRDLPPADGEQQTLSIQRYRTGQVFEPQLEDTTQ